MVASRSLLAMVLIAATCAASTHAAELAGRRLLQKKNNDLPFGGDATDEFKPKPDPVPKPSKPDFGPVVAPMPPTYGAPGAGPAAGPAGGPAAGPSYGNSPRPGASGGARAPPNPPGVKKPRKPKPSPGAAKNATSVCKGAGYTIKAPYLEIVKMEVTFAMPHLMQVAECEALCMAKGAKCRGWYYKKDGKCYMTKGKGSFQSGFDSLKACKVSWSP